MSTGIMHIHGTENHNRAQGTITYVTSTMFSACAHTHLRTHDNKKLGRFAEYSAVRAPLQVGAPQDNAITNITQNKHIRITTCRPQRCTPVTTAGPPARNAVPNRRRKGCSRSREAQAVTTTGIATFMADAARANSTTILPDVAPRRGTCQAYGRQ